MTTQPNRKSAGISGGVEKLGLLIIVVALVLFAYLTIQVLREGFLPEIDRSWALTLKEHAETHPWLRRFFLALTEVGGVPAMTLLASTGVLVAAARKKYRLAGVWALAAGGGALLNLGVKELIDRERPALEIRDARLKESNESFPSGHAMGATIGYGMLAFVLARRTRTRPGRVLVVGFFLVLIVLIGFSRIYLRAHWFSDVVGGFALGTAWLVVALRMLPHANTNLTGGRQSA